MLRVRPPLKKGILRVSSFGSGTDTRISLYQFRIQLGMAYYFGLSDNFDYKYTLKF